MTRRNTRGKKIVPPLNDPWLVAVWPGMGSVASTAGQYLVQKLSATIVADLDVPELFEVRHIDIEHGIIRPGHVPHNRLFEWRNPGPGRDLLIFLGEAQPTSGGARLCRKIIDEATERGAARLFTFAALASHLDPGDPPRVIGGATDPMTLGELTHHGAAVLDEGQISGLNGVLLAAGAARGLPGACLLGELPYFAVGMPNPSAAVAVLELFTRLGAIDLDLEPLRREAAEVERGLSRMMEEMEETEDAEEEVGMIDDEGYEESESRRIDDRTATMPPRLDHGAIDRIERLFNEAANDRAHVDALKRELDRFGVFPEYENRFLDLFRRGD